MTGASEARAAVTRQLAGCLEGEIVLVRLIADSAINTTQPRMPPRVPVAFCFCSISMPLACMQVAGQRRARRSTWTWRARTCQRCTRCWRRRGGHRRTASWRARCWQPRPRSRRGHRWVCSGGAEGEGALLIAYWVALAGRCASILLHDCKGVWPGGCWRRACICEYESRCA